MELNFRSSADLRSVLWTQWKSLAEDLNWLHFCFQTYSVHTAFQIFQIHLPGLCDKPFLRNKKYNNKNAMSQNSFIQTILNEKDANKSRKY